MTEKVNGYLYQGTWFERDMSILHISATGIDFTEDTINGANQEVMKILQTRGTVIGYTVIDATNAHYMFGHAAGSWQPNNFTGDVTITAPPSPPGKAQPDVIGELTAEIDGIAGVSGTAIAVFEGFMGADYAAVAGSEVPDERPANRNVNKL